MTLKKVWAIKTLEYHNICMISYVILLKHIVCAIEFPLLGCKMLWCTLNNKKNLAFELSNNRLDQRKIVCRFIQHSLDICYWMKCSFCEGS